MRMLWRGIVKTAKLLILVVGIWLVAGIINQLPHWWHIAGRYLELYNLCMESRPPSETVMEWLDHIRGCQEVAGRALGERQPLTPRIRVASREPK
jgi:hypothetical protein